MIKSSWVKVAPQKTTEVGSITSKTPAPKSYSRMYGIVSYLDGGREAFSTSLDERDNSVVIGEQAMADAHVVISDLLAELGVTIEFDLPPSERIVTGTVCNYYGLNSNNDTDFSYALHYDIKSGSHVENTEGYLLQNTEDLLGDLGTVEEAGPAEPGPAEVVGRYVFYNNSVWDSSSDDDAIATDKTALLPEQMAEFVNFTNYDKGLNGVMIDISLSPGVVLTHDDFEFKNGGASLNDTDPTTWPVAPAPTITMRPGEGVDGSTRVVLIWSDNAVEKKWLKITVKAAASNGLPEDDVFYFGNAIGESGFGNDNEGVPLDYFPVTTTDRLAAINNPTDSAAVDNHFDFNRDGVVDATDGDIAQSNGTNFLSALRRFAPPV